MWFLLSTLGTTSNESKNAKEIASYKRVIVVTELFTIAVNDFNEKKSARYGQMLVVTEIVVSRTHCSLRFFTCFINFSQL